MRDVQIHLRVRVANIIVGCVPWLHDDGGSAGTYITARHTLFLYITYSPVAQPQPASVYSTLPYTSNTSKGSHTAPFTSNKECGRVGRANLC